MSYRVVTTAVAAVATLAAAPAGAQNQTVTGPKATYWVTAQTSSGMPGMGGGNINPMAMMSGGAGQAQRSLELQLIADGVISNPAAEHVIPAGMHMGASLPLISPAPARAEPRQEPTQNEFNPQALGGRAGRILIFFGCGDAAASGQPLTYSMTAASMRQFGALSENVRITTARPPVPTPGRTFGDWPNERTQRDIPANASLAGEHLIRGNYTPDIRFSLSAAQDFLAPLQLRGLEQPGGNHLTWQSIAGAEGYFVTAVGANEAGDVVMWSSSEVGVGGMHVPDMLTPDDLTRLIRQKVVLPASATECRIPRQVLEAIPQAMVKVVAFGGEVNRSWPERPSDRRQPWNIEYTVKVRYNSVATVMAGMDMSELAGGDDEGEAEGQRPGVTPADVLPIPGGAIGNAVARGIGGFLRRR